MQASVKITHDVNPDTQTTDILKMECKHGHVSTMFCIVLTASYCMLIQAADPVYSPVNLTDTSGNFASSNATIIWADLPTGEAYAALSVSRISDGLAEFYNMVHGFIVAVLPKRIPDGQYVILIPPPFPTFRNILTLLSW